MAVTKEIGLFLEGAFLVLDIFLELSGEVISVSKDLHGILDVVGMDE